MTGLATMELAALYAQTGGFGAPEWCALGDGFLIGLAIAGVVNPVFGAAAAITLLIVC